MSDINDRMKFNSGTDKVTKSVADAVSEVLNSGQAPQTRYEKQAALHNYPLQDKPEVAETFVDELKKEVAELFQQEDASNDKSDDGEGLDKANPKSAKKKFKDRKDKDIDNDGDVDSSDKFLHKKRKAISKAIDKNEDASETRYDARSKSFKETLRRLGYVKEKSLIYTNKKTGK